MTTVKIIDENHPLFGEELTGHLFYHDVYHTGNSPDLFVVYSNGKAHKALSTQIDVLHYEAQLRERVITELGADVGDMVVVLKSGSGSFCARFDLAMPHKITKIGPYGSVELDNGEATMYRPKVEKCP
jgi:hypothetical protein